MTWLTWRQHRVEVLCAAGLLALGLGLLQLLHMRTNPASDVLLSDLHVATFLGILALPAVAGMFVGAPLLGREVEQGTIRLVLTQGVTRWRWLAVELSLAALPLLPAAALLGAAALRQPGPGWAADDPWSWFDVVGLVFPAYVAFGLALGLAAGAVLGRAVPAMAATLVGYVAVRLLVFLVLRPRYAEPLRFVQTDPLQVAPDRSWVVSATPSANGHSMYLLYQPVERFWTFQAIEAAIFAALALILLAVVVFWMRQRAG